MVSRRSSSAPRTWEVLPARIHHVSSSVFDDPARFPVGSIELDSALVMRDIPVEWHELVPALAARVALT